MFQHESNKNQLKPKNIKQNNIYLFKRTEQNNNKMRQKIFENKKKKINIFYWYLKKIKYKTNFSCLCDVFIKKNKLKIFLELNLLIFACKNLPNKMLKISQFQNKLLKLN